MFEFYLQLSHPYVGGLREEFKGYLHFIMDAGSYFVDVAASEYGGL